MHLEEQKKQAREFLRAIRSGNEEALANLRRHHARWADADEPTTRQLVALHDAQFALAREQGFASWSKLKARAEPPSQLRHTRLFVTDMEWLMDRVRGLLRTRQSAGPAALEQIREWHPRFADSTDAEILSAPFSEDDARLVYAREHGFDTWNDFTDRVSILAQRRHAPSAEPFLAAFEALRSRDLSAFQTLLRTHPGLAKDRGTNGNTLLNLAVSEFRHNRPVIEALLAAGADADDGNDRGWTPLHQAAYANQPEIASLLMRHGASLEVEAHGAGGTPMIVALFWGHREVADLLASHSVAPNNLRAAAGLGNPVLMEACFRGERTLSPDAGAARGFFRPHSGFPDWRPSPDPQEILDEALVWACKANRVRALERLVRAGARLAADPYRGTPLIWAAACNRAESIAWLIDHGADVNQKATFGGLDNGEGITALHVAAQFGHLPAARLLIERGADPSIKEDLHQATAEGTANFFGHMAVRDYLRSCQSNF